MRFGRRNMVVMIARSDRFYFALLCAAVAVLLAMLWATGALSGAITPDTGSYLVSARSNNRWGEIRHPGYGLLVSWLGGSAGEPGHIVLIQGILHAMAAMALYAGARAGGIGGAGALCLSFAALFSQSGLFHLRLLLPESLAITLLIFAFAGVLAASNSIAAFRVLLLPIAFTTGLTYLLRPTFLPAILGVPALWYMLALRNQHAGRAVRVALLFCLIAAPFIIQSGYRWKTVDDFNIVSFGGYQMSPLAGFMLTPEIVASLSDTVRPTALAVMSVRDAGEIAGRIARTPLNSVGERSFISAALGYFDIYARSYDYFRLEIDKLRAPDESWIAFNRRLMQFSFATIEAAPFHWVAWVGGATSRLVGRMIVTNATVMVALAVLLVAAMPAFVKRTRLGASAADLPAIFIVALVWLCSTSPLIVLVTFPATRYIDTSAVLVAAMPALLAVALIQGWLKRAVPRAAT